MKNLIAAVVFTFCVLPVVHGAQPIVAIHDSELTRALEAVPASGATPTGYGTTSNQWWTTQWHYFVMPDSAEEALRSDGTMFAVVSDADISAGGLLDGNGLPIYPVVISLASEAVSDAEIAQLTNYVAAGGFLLVGSSAFTRNPDGTTRGDFAFANALGVHMANANLQNWTNNYTFSKAINHRITSHIPGGVLTWQMPSSADEVSWPYMGVTAPERIWMVNPGDATVLAQGDTSPYLLVKQYGKGFFIYDAAMQPLIGHGGYAPGMYAYGVFRKTIEWAFQADKLPIPKLSPWPYPYDAAFMVRHDLEDFSEEISNVAASAQFESANGAKGEYYFCTGTLREEMSNSPAAIAGLRQAVTNYNALIGPHNGGLPNPQNPLLVVTNYDYWHWGPDQALDITSNNLPLPGYANGYAYAFASVSNSFLDVEGWLSGLTNGVRVWVAPYFNATREASYQIENGLGVKITGDDKLGPFPSWTLSTQTPDMRYGLLQLPVSDWYIQFQVAQSMETGHTEGTAHDLVDYYYNLGALINLYSHTLSTGDGTAGSVAPDYVTYGLNTTLHPRVWSVNSLGIYSWWLQRSNVQVTASYATNGNQSVTTLSISGATDPQTAVELLIPSSSVSGLQILTNGIVASGGSYRTNGPIIKLLVGTSVTNAQISYLLNPEAGNDSYTVNAGQTLTVSGPGVLNNDTAGAGTNLTAVLVSGPAYGALSLNTNGGFSYTPATNYAGVDTFTYQAYDGVTNSLPATVTMEVIPSGNLFFDDFGRSTNADPLAPWAVGLGKWWITNGVLQGTASGSDDYAETYAGTNWTDYSLQARIQIPGGVQAWAAGLSGRLNPLTGEKYTANVYPEGSPLSWTNGAPALRLIKFHGWRNWSYTPMALVPLPAVGTNWHTLKLTFQGNRIGVYFDGNQVVNVTDNGFDGVPAYTNGAIGAHMYMDTAFAATFDDVQVIPLLAMPVASDDSYGVIENRTLTVPAPGVLTNDTPGTGTNLTALLVNGPANGILTLNPNGGFSYTPTNNYVGTDSFTYQANDGVTNSSPATVTITVTTNYPPVANNDSYNVGENRTLTISAPGVLGNDTDANGDSLTAVLPSGPVYGTLNLNTNGGFTYTPATNFVGVDTFNYLANDGWVNSATAAIVTITVTTNQPPVANNDSYSVAENMTLTVAAPGVLGNDTDTDGDNLTAVLLNGPVYGTLNLNTNGGFTYTPAPNFVGVDTFNYLANDGWVNLATAATVTITVTTNQPPVANNDSYSVAENMTLTIAAPGVLGNDADTDGGNLTALLVSGPAHGSLNLNANGGFSYAPTTNYIGVDTFTYQASDGQISSSSATVTITVTTNLPPVATNDFYTVAKNTTLSVPAAGVLGNDADADGDSLMAVLVGGPTQGTLNLSTNGGFTYTPSNNFAGMDFFTYQASDGVLNSGTATVTIDVTPPGCLFFDNFMRSTNADPLAPWNIGVGQWVITNGVLQGTASSLPDYTEVYAGTNWGDYSVQSRMQFANPSAWGAGLNGRVNPQTGARYTMMVCPEGSPLAQGGLPVMQLIKFGAWRNWNVGSPMAQVILSGVGTNWNTLKLAFLGNQIAVYYNGNQVASVTDNGVDNGFGATPAYTNGAIGAHAYMSTLFQATFDDVIVRSLAADDFYSVNENTPLSVSAPGVLGNDTGVYGTNLTAVLVSGPANGMLNLSTNGGFSYTPATNYVGTDSFTYQAYDGQTNLGTATVTIRVVPGIAMLTVTVDSMSRAYGNTNPPLTGSLVGVQDGDNITATYATMANTNSPVGTYAIVPVFNDPSNRLGNYIIITNGGTLTLTQAMLTVSANNASRAYGATNPVFTVSYNGFVNGDGTNVLSGAPMLTTSAMTNSPVGSYVITNTMGSLVATNYTVSLGNGSLTVTGAVLTATANNASRAYGAINPVFTVSYSGFVNGDGTNVLFGAPMLTTSAMTNSPVGSYVITNTMGSLVATNYTVSLGNGSLTVTGAVLTATANNASRAYGATNPVFTVSYSGFVNGDGTNVLFGAPMLTTSAMTNSPVGAYTITNTIGILVATNYTVSLGNGSLTVTGAVLTATANNASRAYGATNPVFTVSYSGFVNGDGTNVLSGAPMLTTSAMTNSPVGSYVITNTMGSLVATNYTVSLGNGSLTVTGAVLTATANNASRAYGAINPVFTVSYSGFVNGDGTNVLSGAPMLTTSAVTNSPVGSYVITNTMGSLVATNYTVSLGNGSLTVTGAVLTATANNASRAYGATNPVFTVSYSGFVNGDGTNVLFGAPMLTTSAMTNSPVGAYTITNTMGSLVATNYTVSLGNGSLTVTGAMLTATANNASRAYGAINPVFTVSYSGFVNGDGTNVLSGAPMLTTSAVTNSPVGSYVITNTMGSLVATNYTVSLGNGSLTVTGAVLTATANNASRAYGATNPVFTVSYSGFVNGDGTNVLFGAPMLTTSAMTNSPVGAYTITNTMGSLVATNYTVSLGNGSLTVTGAVLTATANNASRAYGATNPVFTVSYSGFVNGDGTNVLSGAPLLTTSAMTNSPVGAYTITNTIGTLVATNYTISLANGSLTVTGAVLTATANIGIAANNKVYDGTPAATISSNNVILLGVVAGDTVSLVTNGYTATFASVGVGNGIGVTVSGLTLTGASATNYTLTQPVGLTANITAKALTVTSIPAPVITSICLTNGVVTIAWNSVAGGIYRAQYIDNLNGAGWNDLLPDMTSTGLTTTQTNVVGNAPQRFYRIKLLNPGITANNKVYDGTTVATISSNNVALSGVVGGDTVSLSTNGYTANFASAGAGNNIGVTVSGLTLTGTSATNYTLTQPVGLTANITPATLTVSADNYSRAYGATNPVLTASYSGFENGDTIGVLSGNPALNTAATTNSPVGTYAITVGPGTLSATNYAFSFTNGLLTVGQATLTVSADNYSRAYGATNPVLTASYSGFENGDTIGVLSGNPALNTATTTNSPVGTYAITVGPGTLSATNYAFSFTNGLLTVGQATLTVSADNYSRAYGAPNPVLTASYSGFVNGETLVTSGVTGNPNLTTTANTASPAGNYPITVTNGTLSAANYTFSFVNGTLTVYIVQPTILSIAGVATTNSVISWSAISNVTYRVQYQSDLGSTNWLNLTPDVTATSNMASAVDNPAGAVRRFYRIMIVP